MSGSSTEVLLELLARLASDRSDGGLRPLAEYLALYPGHEELVAAESGPTVYLKTYLDFHRNKPEFHRLKFLKI